MIIAFWVLVFTLLFGYFSWVTMVFDCLLACGFVVVGLFSVDVGCAMIIVNGLIVLVD